MKHKRREKRNRLTRTMTDSEKARLISGQIVITGEEIYSQVSCYGNSAAPTGLTYREDIANLKE